MSQVEKMSLPNKVVNPIGDLTIEDSRLRDLLLDHVLPFLRLKDLGRFIQVSPSF